MLYSPVPTLDRSLPNARESTPLDGTFSTRITVPNMLHVARAFTAAFVVVGVGHRRSPVRDDIFAASRHRQFRRHRALPASRHDLFERRGPTRRESRERDRGIDVVTRTHFVSTHPSSLSRSRGFPDTTNRFGDGGFRVFLVTFLQLRSAYRGRRVTQKSHSRIRLLSIERLPPLSVKLTTTPLIPTELKSFKL